MSAVPWSENFVPFDSGFSDTPSVNQKPENTDDDFVAFRSSARCSVHTPHRIKANSSKNGSF